MVDLINHSFEKLLELAVSDFDRDARPKHASPAKPPPLKPASDRAQQVKVPAEGIGPGQPAPATGDDVPVRPRRRPPVPVLTVLDDGSFEAGQEIRIRTDTFTIGRTHGDLIIPNDVTISGQHAELRLSVQGDQKAWTLKDLGSSNRTFVRVQSATLLPGMAVLIGTRRFQLRSAASEPLPQLGPNMTCQIPQRPAVGNSFDTLVELPGMPSQAGFPLRSSPTLIGRDPSQCGIHFDDPALATIHAEFIQQPDQTWMIRARPSTNGIWVSTKAIRLSGNCFFQCGEQRFRFVLP